MYYQPFKLTKLIVVQWEIQQLTILKERLVHGRFAARQIQSDALMESPVGHIFPVQLEALVSYILHHPFLRLS